MAIDHGVIVESKFGHVCNTTHICHGLMSTHSMVEREVHCCQFRNYDVTATCYADRCSRVHELGVWRDSYTRDGEGDGVARNLNTIEYTRGNSDTPNCKQFKKAFLDGPSRIPIALVHTRSSQTVQT